MNLLPKTHTEFASSEYWNKFFKQRGSKAFEWYGEYGELCGIIHKYMKLQEKILVIGCGNSRLSCDMYDVGYTSIINIDISEVVIRQMNQANCKQRPSMKFLQMDMLSMDFEDGSFSVVFDKGTLDALMTDDSAEVKAKVMTLFSEVDRVLRLGGRYICVSLAQQHILQTALTHFANLGWPVRICRISQENTDDDREFRMPVFVYIFTKFKKLPNSNPILEISEFEEKVSRVGSVEELLQSVKAMQYYGIVRQQLNTREELEDSVTLELYNQDSPDPRYRLHVINSNNKFPNKFAIFIVPAGREREWMFATEAGREQLAMSAGFQRLVVVCLHPHHSYDNLDQIKAELSAKVMELAPPNVHSAQVPFLSLGDEINKRNVVHRGTSVLSGDFIVEDVDRDGSFSRQLVFLNSLSIVQSQARLKPGGSKKKGKKGVKKMQVDLDYLGEPHHASMVGGLALIQDPLTEKDVRCILIGLGGGGLASFLHRLLPRMKIDAVELDESIVKVAKDWFGLVVDKCLQVHVEDGVNYIQRTAEKGEQMDVVIIDVDNKDMTIGISSPPRAFLEPGLLDSVSSLLKPTGVLILNLCCRDKNLRGEILQDLKLHFKTVYSKSIAEHVNEVVYCLPNNSSSLPELSRSNLPQNVTDTLQNLEKSLPSSGSEKLETISIINSLRGIHLE